MIADDVDLLDLMLADQEKAQEIFKPTNYWRNYVAIILRELRTEGLNGFRGREGSFLSTFGATDPSPLWRVLLDNRRVNNHRTRRMPGVYRLLTLADRMVTDFIGERLFHSGMIYGLTPADIERSAYDHASQVGADAGARPLRDLDISLEGEPRQAFWHAGKPMTMSMLNYYLRYAYVARFTRFEDAALVVELGSGSGKQVEVTLKLHPHLCFFLFDIPPQLYVCEQFLKSVFPGQVVSYRECRDMTRPPPIAQGKIFIFGNWQFPLIERANVDIFWNCASLHEMEPSIVATYLRSVNVSARAAYLNEVMTGVSRASRPGQHGVLEQTQFEHYKNGLAAFRCVDSRPALAPLTVHPGYSDSYWTRTSTP